MRKNIGKIIFFLMIITSLCLGTSKIDVAYADTIQEVTLQVTYDQTAARSMLPMINSFRTGDEAWAYDSSNNKVYYNNLNSLVYDYELEKVAMQRAAEIAVLFDHSRPDGNWCWSTYSDLGVTYYGAGENIAAGYRTAEKVFEGWQETNEQYAGQGHRRNMLSGSFTAVGIGHAVYNGYHFWVQEFRSNAGTLAETPANNSSQTVKVKIDTSLFGISLNSSENSLSIFPNKTADLPTITATLTNDDIFPYKKCTVTPPISWSVSDSSIIKISNGKIVALQEGTTNIVASALGKTISIPVTVAQCTHTWGTGTVTTAATCTTAGEKKYICSVCGETKTEPVSALGHSYSTSWTVDKAATCTAKGSKSHHCTRSGCAAKTDVTAIEMIPHSWNSGTVKKESSCTATGEKEYECTVCHTKKTEVIEKKVHTEVTDPAVAATCTTPGKTAGKHCSVCTTVTVPQTTVDALGHAYSVAWTIDKEATCLEVGSKSHHCIRNGCTAKNGVTVIDKGPHSWNKGTEVTPATCTEDGEMSYECTVCHEPKTVTIAAKGHTVVTLPAVAATCTKAGKTAGKKCSVCEEILVAQNDVAALGHIYSKSWTVDKAATYTATGSKSYHCTRSGCTAKSTVTVIPKLNAITGTASYTKTYSASAQAFTLDSKAKNGKLSYVPNTSKVTVKAGKVTITKGFCGVAKITVKASGSDCATATKVITITVKPSTAKISTLKNSAKGTASITWTKQSYVTGYEINYSTSSSFSGAKTIDVPKYSTVSKSITKLTKGKTYYFRIRAYKTVSGKKVYGAYSAKKYIKITK